MSRWRVENEISAQGLPAQSWAAAAQARLRADTAVEYADVSASLEVDEVALNANEISKLTVSAVVRAPDAPTAAELVERDVVGALEEVVGDRNVGWTAYDWEARPETDGCGR
jgi:hypothetical protein